MSENLGSLWYISIAGTCSKAVLKRTHNLCFREEKITRTVRGSDYSPAKELSEQKGKLVTATGDTEKYSEKQAKSG